MSRNLSAKETHSSLSGVRLDKWLWAARFFKTRSLAQQAVDGGKVRLNQAPVKPAREVHPGDVIHLQREDGAWEVTVKGLSEKRGPASEASTLYEESEASRQRREAEKEARRLAPEPASFLEGGRPTKRDRRQLARWRG